MTNKRACNKLSIEDAAWIGGFYDGEGCVTYRYAGRNSTGRYLNVGITQNEREVLDWIQKVTGVGSVTVNREAFQWRAYGLEALSFLEEIELYIRTKNHKNQLENVLFEMEKDGRL